MELRQYCGTRQRRQKVAAFKDVVFVDPVYGDLQLNGIDYLEVLDDNVPDETLRQRIIDLVFLKQDGVSSADNPPASILGKDNFVIEGGTRITNINIKKVEVCGAANILRLTLDGYGDHSIYTLIMRKDADSSEPPDNMDHVLSRVEFTFKADCPSDFDCRAASATVPEIMPSPALDYLAKDYESFRRLMLDRMAETIPDWVERSPADLGVTLVEVLAYAADHASYYQDAVATEAYLPLARLRPSVQRHTRLLGYRLSQGCNARTFVAIMAAQDSPAGGVALRKGTRLLTGPEALAAQPDPVLKPDYEVFRKLRAAGAVVFETMEDVMELRTARNVIAFHTWGEEGCCLPAGTTSAHLVGTTDGLRLEPGDVLILEERIPAGGRADDPPDIDHRQAVKLTGKPVDMTDLLTGKDVVEVHWQADDALRFPLNIGGPDSRGAVAYGNVVLADHGMTIRYGTWYMGDEDAAGVRGDDDPGLSKQAGLVPPASPGETGEGYRPRLLDIDITYACIDKPEALREKSATATLVQDAGMARPAVSLSAAGDTWYANNDLLGSSRFSPEFVVEQASDGSAFLRFGDNRFGKRPGTGESFAARIRTGNGPVGNVSADAIRHIITDAAIEGVRNPLPATGGTLAETLVNAKIHAPRAFRKQRRAVTPEDYSAFAESHPDVQKAVTERRWTGSWHTMFISVDRYGGRKVDEQFESDLRGHIGQFRLAGHDMEIEDGISVPLDIELVVCVDNGYYKYDVERELLSVFGTGVSQDGKSGFFHPDNYTFGQPVLLSVMVSRAMRVKGVRWAGIEKNNAVARGHFRRLYEQSVDYADDGEIPIGRREIVRLDNDPNAPENGRLSFIMEGGNA